MEALIGHEKKELSLEEAIKIIIFYNEKIGDFWSKCHGWAPESAANLLAKSRLDWQVSLSHTMMDWIDVPDAEDPRYEGRLILAWANLGTLIENSLKLFLSVYLETYKQTKTKDPDGETFDNLRNFFKQNIWVASDKKDRDDFILKVQQKRNAIHAYKNRDISDYDEFHMAIFEYLEILKELDLRLPYPEHDDYR